MKSHNFGLPLGSRNVQADVHAVPLSSLTLSTDAGVPRKRRFDFYPMFENVKSCVLDFSDALRQEIRDGGRGGSLFRPVQNDLESQRRRRFCWSSLTGSGWTPLDDRRTDAFLAVRESRGVPRPGGESMRCGGECVRPLLASPAGSTGPGGSGRTPAGIVTAADLDQRTLCGGHGTTGGGYLTGAPVADSDGLGP
jgi:hypothetical protein